MNTNYSKKVFTISLNILWIYFVKETAIKKQTLVAKVLALANFLSKMRGGGGKGGGELIKIGFWSIWGGGGEGNAWIYT